MGELRLWAVSLALLLLLNHYVASVGSLLGIFGSWLLCLHLAWCLVRWYRQSSFTPKLMIPPSQRLVVITGCDSGFGLQSAKRLDYAGFHVLACCLDLKSNGAKELNQYASKRVQTVQLDVTKDADIDRLVQILEYLTGIESECPKFVQEEPSQTSSIFEPSFPKPMFGYQDGELKLWAVINNAGILHYGPCELMDMNKLVRQVMNVNFFGPWRVAQATLPFLRKSKGRLINMGSITDQLCFPYIGAYSASKFAVRAMTDSLRTELKRFPVQCCLIEPFPCKTKIFDNINTSLDKTFEQAPALVTNAYGGDSLKERLKQSFLKMVNTARVSSEEVVDAVEDAVSNADPQDEYWCGHWRSKLLMWLCLQLPSRVRPLLIKYM